MEYGKSKHWPNTWFAAIYYNDDEDQVKVEPEYNKKWRLLHHYSWQHDYQGDYTIFLFDETSWTKLSKKEYFIMWKLEGS